MFCYRDRCFCLASNRALVKGTDIKVCKNKKCDMHACNVPFDKLPEWMPIAWSDFHEKCGEYK